MRLMEEHAELVAADWDTDIESRKQSEQQLRIMEKALEASIHGIVIADAFTRQPNRLRHSCFR